jgi:H+/gluconate symporter-like permease
MLGVAAIVVALGLLMFLAFRGVTVLVLGPAMATLAALIAGGLPLLAAYTQIFMGSAGDFIVAYFPLFLLGAIFGKLMDDSGAARAIAGGIIDKLGEGRAILAVVLCCAVLTYGGVSLFVVAFAVFPIAAALFRQADIPKRLIPAALALGSFTFTMSALPGTPAIQNAIPMPFFGTTAFAAPGLGIIAGAIMLGLGTLWLDRRAGTAAARGEGYGGPVDAADDAPRKPDGRLREQASPAESFDLNEIGDRPAETAAPPSFLLSVAPVVLVIAMNFAFLTFILPRMDTGYLAEPQFGATTVESVRGVWAIIVALLTAIGFLLAVFWRRLDSVRTSIDRGADASVLPIFNTASLVGFGAVVAALPAFDLVRDAVLSLGGENPLISLAVAVNVLAAMTGSASGGMTIALGALGPTYLDLAQQAGISPDILHRVTAVAAGTLDALPHNGAVITLLSIAGLTHRQAYADIFVVAIAIPLLALVAMIALASLAGSF